MFTFPTRLLNDKYLICNLKQFLKPFTAIALSLADENKTLKTTIKPEPTETYPGISQSKDVSFPVTKMVHNENYLRIPLLKFQF